MYPGFQFLYTQLLSGQRLTDRHPTTTLKL